MMIKGLEIVLVLMLNMGDGSSVLAGLFFQIATIIDLMVFTL